MEGLPHPGKQIGSHNNCSHLKTGGKHDIAPIHLNVLFVFCFQTELKELKERIEIEKEAWEENYRKKHENYLMVKERELKENVKKDRNKEIELVIRQLEEDATAAREDCERVAENRIK